MTSSFLLLNLLPLYMKLPHFSHWMLIGNIILISMRPCSIRLPLGIFEGSKSGGMYLFNTLRSPILSFLLNQSDGSLTQMRLTVDQLAAAVQHVDSTSTLADQTRTSAAGETQEWQYVLQDVQDHRAKAGTRNIRREKESERHYSSHKTTSLQHAP